MLRRRPPREELRQVSPVRLRESQSRSQRSERRSGRWAGLLRAPLQIPALDSTPDLWGTGFVDGFCFKAPVEGLPLSRALVGQSRKSNFIPAARGSHCSALGQGSIVSSAKPPPLGRPPRFPWFGTPPHSEYPQHGAAVGHSSASPPGLPPA